MVILRLDLTHSCWNCDEPLPENPIDVHYCSIECHDEAQERDERARARYACCDECGYDRQEHNPQCSKATELDRQREGVGE